MAGRKPGFGTTWRRAAPAGFDCATWTRPMPGSHECTDTPWIHRSPRPMVRVRS